jgi:hypothetical protein
LPSSSRDSSDALPYYFVERLLPLTTTAPRFRLLAKLLGCT